MKRMVKKTIAILLAVVLFCGAMPLMGVSAVADQLESVVISPYVYLHAEKSAETIKMSGVSYSDAIVFNMGYNGQSNGYTGEVNYNLKGNYKSLSFDAGYVRGHQRDASFTVLLDGAVAKNLTIKYTDIAKNFTFDVTGVSRVTIRFESNAYDKTYYAIGNIKMLADKEIEEEEPLTCSGISPYLTTNVTTINDTFKMGGKTYTGGYELKMGYTGNSSTGGMAQLVFNFQGKADYMSFDICQFKETLYYNRNCTMKITVDDEVLYDSEVIGWNDIPKHYTINLEGVNQVIIRTDSSGYDNVYYRIANLRAGKCEHQWTIPSEGGVACDTCGKEYFFKFGEDNFGFTNEEHGTNNISWKGYIYAFNGVRVDILSLVAEKISIKYNGACFGMAAMNASFYNGMSTSDFGGETTFSLNNTQKVSDSINIMLWSQASLITFAQTPVSLIQGLTSDREQLAKEIVKLAKNVKEGDFLPIVQFDNHAVNIIGILPESMDEDYFYVLLNDSNNIEFPSVFIISKDYKEIKFSKVLGAKKQTNGGLSLTIPPKGPEEVQSIQNIITNENYNIDNIAPGLRQDILGLYGGSTRIARTASNFDTYSTETSEEKFRNENIMFIVDNQTIAQIKSSSGKSIDIACGKVINTTYDEISCYPIIGTDLIKVVVKNDGDTYNCTSEGAMWIYINNDGKIGVVESDKDVSVTYSLNERITINPLNNSVEYKISFYKENLMKNGEAFGVSTGSITNTPVSIVCKEDAVTINRTDDKEQKVIISEFNNDVIAKEYDVSEYANIKISADSENDEYIIEEGESGRIESVSSDDISLKYKDVDTIAPKIITEGFIDYTVSYESSNPDVVSVDDEGNIVATGKGEAEIIVTVTDMYGNIYTDTCQVEVSYTFIQLIIMIVLFGWIWY